MSKFSVGERVVCYSDYMNGANRFIGTIIDISETSGVLIKRGPEYNCRWFHPKQLRKLKPKPKQPEAPEFVWVNWYHGYEGCDAPEKTRKDADRNADLTRIACVKYRRVSEGNGNEK